MMPEENVIKVGEQWEVDLAGFGKMTVSVLAVFEGMKKTCKSIISI